MTVEPDCAPGINPIEEGVVALFEDFQERLDAIMRGLTLLDHYGPASDCAPGSTAHEQAALRDRLDLRLSRFRMHVDAILSIRARTSSCLDLLVDESMGKMGEGLEALRLMRLWYARDNNERGSDGRVPPETFPHFFVWDTYQRVLALGELAGEFPGHVRTAAAELDGWPMIVCHHLKHEDEFARLSEFLRLGSAYPFDVSPRRKRGAGTPLFQYIEPIAFLFHRFRATTLPRKSAPSDGEFRRLVTLYLEPEEGADTMDSIVEIFRAALALPPLTRESAAAWSHEILVPFILATDALDPSRATVPALRNIWNHRAVKSIPTFRSRLESAVTDTLRRYARSYSETAE